MSLKEMINGNNSKHIFVLGVLWLSIFIIGCLIWYVLFIYTAKNINVLIFIFYLFSLVTLFTLFLDMALSMLGLPKKRVFRLAFILSILIPTVLLEYFTIANLNSNLPKNLILMDNLFGLLFIFLGSLSGIILIVAIHKNLIENHPPSQELQNSIIRYHEPIQNILVDESLSKRFFDISLSIIGILISLPLMVVISFLILFEDPGPVFYIKNSVGKGGKNFKLIKFRTLKSGAEESVSVIAGGEHKEIVLKVGQILRKTALDELPQLFNILNGEMSFVGPRPHRSHLVLHYLQEVPGFIDRHRVLPGLAGLAQVAGNASTPPHQKVRYDRIYIDNMSLGFDLKLLFLSFMIAFWYRWQADWDGKVPGKWLHS